MCSSLLVSQPSLDLSIYLPSELDVDESQYQSADILIHSINFDAASSGHRLQPDIFDPITEDVNASSTLIDDAASPINNNNFYMNDIATYFFEQSTVIPHTTYSPVNFNVHLSPPGNQIDIRQFLVFDETTGRERRPLLHEFIRLILENDAYSDIAEYIDRKQGIFKLHKPRDVAELWKHVKGRNSDSRKRNFLIKKFFLIEISLLVFRNDL